MQELREILKLQRAVARAYSPLNAAILGVVEARLADEGDPLAISLEHFFARVQSSSKLTAGLRLAAVLHAYVLEDHPDARALRPYYASVGGSLDPTTDERFAEVVGATLDALREELIPRALSWRVQTNETARGLSWLLPVSILDLDEVHLIEFGASAGLNLYAEQRRYALLEQGRRVVIGEPTEGEEHEPQFELLSQGAEILAAHPLRTPKVLSRVGADDHPVRLDEGEGANHLQACIWADKPARLERLREGIELHRRALAGELAPLARVDEARLPEELDSFMVGALPPRCEAPVVVFNTYVTAYFSDVEHRDFERRLRSLAHEHAMTHRVPWIWVRYEPPRKDEPEGPKPAWCRWRVELFNGNTHRSIMLGWGHPHMAELHFGPGLGELLGLRGED